MPTSTYDLELTLTTDAPGDAWSAAPGVLGEREYRTEDGVVRVRFDWAAVRAEPFTRVSLEIVDDRQDGDARDLPAFVDLFFHDVFLMFNLAAPGSFGGVVTAAGGEYGVREVALDPWVFEYADAEALPLRDVVQWYDSLGLGTRQIATGGAAAALFHLLHLARVEEEDATSIVRLSLAGEALGLPRDARLFELRDAIVSGAAPVVHPMYDESLDSRLEDASLDWSDAIDRAAGAVIGALQRQVRGA
jgi:hypothetical protein